MNKDTAYILTHINIFHSINPIGIRRYISHFDIYITKFLPPSRFRHTQSRPLTHTQLPTIVPRQGM